MAATASWTVAPDPAEVPEVRRAAVDFARRNGVPDPPLADLRLAVSEAVTNAVVHAFAGTEEKGTITVTVDVEPGQSVEVVVQDDGHGMARRDDSPGLGLGLPLIQRLADHVEVRRPRAGIGTELWMRFALEVRDGARPIGD